MRKIYQEFEEEMYGSKPVVGRLLPSEVIDEAETLEEKFKLLYGEISPEKMKLLVEMHKEAERAPAVLLETNIDLPEVLVNPLQFKNKKVLEPSIKIVDETPLTSEELSGKHKLREVAGKKMNVKLVDALYYAEATDSQGKTRIFFGSDDLLLVASEATKEFVKNSGNKIVVRNTRTKELVIVFASVTTKSQ